MPIFSFNSYSGRARSAATAALALGSVFSAAPLLADDMSDNSTSNNTIEEVIVRAHPLSAEGLTQGTVSLAGPTLNRNLAPNLGDVLSKQPGIHSASFGAAVGRPIIQGLGGARIQVMEDRLSTMDVSVTSGDHATTVEPFIASSVEVLKGPATLLYGNGAVGGVVDVHTGRIPHGQLGEAFSGKISAQGSDNGDQHAVAARLDGEGDGFAWHFDGFDRRSINYDIPGETESDALIAAEEAEGEEHEEEASPGFLPGSHFSTDGGALGFSFTGENWFSGIAVSQLNAVYGLPGGHGHHDEEEEHEDLEEEEHEDEEGFETPILDMDQTRVDIEMGRTGPLFSGNNGTMSRFGSTIESVNLRLGFNDYEHSEVEPDGEVATLFKNEAFEARLEFVHAFADVKHVWGLQFAEREFSVSGEEAFVPPVDSENIGLFWLSERDLNNVSLEMGLRLENVEHAPEGAAKADFMALAGSIGAIYPINDEFTLTANLGYAERAPVGEELFSNGPHLATGRFEIGTATLDEETVLRTDLILGWERDNLQATLNAYYASFSDFIYQNPNGMIEDELPVFLWDQADATFRGLDGEVRWKDIEFVNGNLELRGFFDVIRASLDASSEKKLPLIPPNRIGLGATQRWGAIALTLEAMRVGEQDEIPSYELPTDSYTDLGAYLEWQPTLPNGQQLAVFLRGDNLTDAEQRYHTSFIKDLAPQPGRTITLGMRYQF
jgi:iron complex outermembrane receptor protein